MERGADHVPSWPTEDRYLGNLDVTPSWQNCDLRQSLRAHLILQSSHGPQIQMNSVQGSSSHSPRGDSESVQVTIHISNCFVLLVVTARHSRLLIVLETKVN